MAMAILNTSILTNFGSYRFTPMTMYEARRCVLSFETKSFIGHNSTAHILTTLLGVDVPMNREQYSQEVDDMALIFKLNGRPEEGKILSVEEIEKIGYSFGILVREA